MSNATICNSLGIIYFVKTEQNRFMCVWQIKDAK
jgi:hypothetical protein